MKLFSLDISTLVIRYYLMMAIIIGAFLAGVPWLSILALPVFFSALIGSRITRPEGSAVRRSKGQVAPKRQRAVAAQSQPAH